MQISTIQSSHEPLFPSLNAAEDYLRNQFISIDGVDINVFDFLKIWNNEKVTPILSPADEKIFNPTEPDFSYNYDKFDRFSTSVIKILSHIFSPSQKLKHIKKIVEEYKAQQVEVSQLLRENGIVDIHRVLAAKALLEGDQQILRTDLDSYVARFENPTSEGSACIASTRDEVESLVPRDEKNERKTRYVNTESAKPLIEVLIPEYREMIINALKSINTEEIPTVMFEKAVMEHEPRLDDLKELSNFKNIGSEQLTNYVKLLRNIGITGGLTGVLMNMGNPGSFAAFEALCYLIGSFSPCIIPFEAWKNQRLTKSSIKKYAKMYKKLSSKINNLNKTPFGRLKVSLLKLIVLHVQSDDIELDTEIGQLAEFIGLLEDDKKQLKEFEDFVIDATCEYDFSDPLKIVTDFKDYREYVSSEVI